MIQLHTMLFQYPVRSGELEVTDSRFERILIFDGYFSGLPGERKIVSIS